MSRSPLIPLFARLVQQARTSRLTGIPLPEVVEQHAERARTRRRFLQGMVAAGALLAVPKLAHAEDLADFFTFKRTSQPTIAIIGGGMAGLHCAWRLNRKGLRATVYEAATRTGGRMLSDRTTFSGSGQTCELGGEFIDTGHKMMRKLAHHFDLILEDKEQDLPGLTDVAGYFNGRTVPYAELLTLFAPIAAKIDASLATLTVPVKGISYANPNGGEALDAMSLTQWLNHNNVHGIGRELVTVAHEIEWGLDANEMNAYDMLGLISTNTKKIELFGDSDERFHIAGGNDQIPTRLAAELSGQIETGQVLERISQRADGRFVLQFAGRSTTVVADHIVSAIPFNILRTIDLDLPLPALKRTAINELGYGQNTKCMTGYASRPWRTQGSNGESFSDLAYQNTWDTAQMQAGAHGILTEYTGGSRALTAGTGTTAAHASNFVSQINHVYPGTAAAYSGEAIRLAWNTMPFNQASYSAYLVGQYTKFAGTEGDRVGNFHFAGEHTDFDYQGYMEGAARSGARVAKEILTDEGLSDLSAAG